MLATLLLLVFLPQAATVQGTVRDADTHEPIAHATIQIPALGRGVLTNKHGFFVLPDVPTGQWKIQARALGHRLHEVTLQIPSRGTVRVEFELETEPVALTGISVLTTRARTAAGGAAPERALFDREVVPGVVTISGDEIRAIPALAEADVLRSLQALPGVVQRNDLSAQLHVRGGGPDQNLFLFDGARVFAPYHLFGMFGAFNADAVERVEFYRGALPARYGGALSSVVDIEQREGSERLRVDAGLSLLGLRGTARGNLPWGDANWLLAGRRTHLDLVAEQQGYDFPYAFHDLQGRLSFAPAPGQRVQASLFTSADRFRMFFGNSGGDLHSHWNNTVGSVRWTRASAGGWSWTANAWGSAYGGKLVVGDSTIQADDATTAGDGLVASMTTENRIRVGGLQLEAVRQGEDTGVRVGLDVQGGAIALLGDEQPGSYIVGETRGAYLLPAAYIEAERWFGPVRLAPGLRLGYETRAGRLLVEPRLAGRYYLTDELALTLAVGRSHQVLSTLQDDRNVLPGAPLWFVHPDTTPASRTDGVSAEIEGWAGHEWSFSGTVYARAFTDVPRWRPVGTRKFQRLAFDDGRALGLELSLRKHAGRLTGWLGYGLSHVRLTEKETGEPYAAAWDRRHSLDATLLVKPWPWLSLSSRAIYGSGLPFWPFAGYVATPRFYPLAGGARRESYFAPYWADEQMRYPAYFRLDLGMRLQFQWGRAQIQPFAQVLNVTRRPNVLYYELSSLYNGPENFGDENAVLRPVDPFPFSLMPSVGVDVHF